MEFAKIGNLYAVQISDTKFIDQMGDVRYKNKESNIKMISSSGIPRDILSAFEYIFATEKEYSESCRNLEYTKKNKNDALALLKNLSKETLCTAEEFLREFYNAIPADIKYEYFDLGLMSSLCDSDSYHIESNFSTKYGPDGNAMGREIYLRRLKTLTQDKNIIKNIVNSKGYLTMGVIPTNAIECLKQVIDLLKKYSRPLPLLEQNNFEEYAIVSPNDVYAEKISVCSMYTLPLVEKYLTKEYASRLAKEFFK